MARTQKFKIEGLAELDEALTELPRATTANVLKRALTNAAEPIADVARSLAPQASGFLRDHIIVSAKIKNTVGNSEFAAAMRAGLGRAAAGKALRAARSGAAGTGSNAEVYVGPTVQAFYGMFQEFGTAYHGAKPFLRPAFDSQVELSLSLFKDELTDEIEKARARLARKAERLAAKMRR